MYSIKKDNLPKKAQTNKQTNKPCMIYMQPLHIKYWMPVFP